MGIKCKRCGEKNAILKRPKTSDAMCKECFFFVFEEEIHKTIVDAKLFKEGDRVAVGASGGKGNRLVYNFRFVLIVLIFICIFQFRLNRSCLCIEIAKRASQLWY
jgi:hypothetical protein